jgi:hypothetical protein
MQDQFSHSDADEDSSHLEYHAMPCQPVTGHIFLRSMVRPYSLSCSPSSYGMLQPEGDSTMFLHDVSNYLPIHCVEHPNIQDGAEMPNSFKS